MLPASALAKRHHVVIVKPSPQPVRVAPLAVIPPLALFYDLTRRTNCQGDVLGLGGPGFTSAITPATGNVMTTAYARGVQRRTKEPEMIEGVIYGLIYICLLALAIYLILWVLGTVVGIALPPKVVQIIWVIFILVCVLILVQMVLPRAGFRLGALLPLFV